MTKSYSKRRLDFFNTLVKKKRSDIIYGRLWTLEPQHLRFKHGESIAELKVPYHLGADDEARVEEAVAGIASLLARRFEPEEDAAPARQNVLSVAQSAPVSLKEKTYRTDIFISGSFEKSLAMEILGSVPAVDSAILSCWLAPDGPGRGFVKWLSAIIGKALKDEAKNGWEERTSYLALLAVINTVHKKKEKTKNLRIRGLTYEKMDLAVGLTMYSAVRAGIEDLLERLKASGASYLRPFTESLLRSAVVPRAFLSIPSNILSSSLNPYRINADTFRVLTPYAGDFSEEISDKTELIRETAEKVRSNPGALEAVRLQHDILRFRQIALAYMGEFDTPGLEAQELLFDLYSEEQLIKNFLGDQRTASRLADALEEVKEKYARDPRRGQAVAEFQRFVSPFKKSVLSGLLWGAKKEEVEGIETIVENFYACKFDDHVERFESLMRAYLADRRGEFDQKTLKEEYNTGRLYRFSSDDRPILKTLELNEESQLFVDMKDFTRKTLKVKEIAMADFMKEHFYKPILTAASRYGQGAGVQSDEKSIRLNNLPGDAAIFSGGISHMVDLARDIQRVISRYRETLEKKLPPRKDTEILEEVHKRFESKRAELKKKRAELNRALDKNERGLELKLIALGEEEHRLENTYRDELEDAIKGELEAGLYISYGAKAETMILDLANDTLGTVKVTIGEKINEAARGTFRHAMVRAKLEILLESERQRRKNKDLAYPFDIYIDRIYSLRMPPELEAPFERLIAQRKPSGADAMSRIMSNEFYNDLKKIISGEPFSTLRLLTALTDIYNKGHALSSSALHAYMRETRGTRFFFQNTIEVEELHKDIQKGFFFPSGPLEFWFGHEIIKGVERFDVFYKSGEVIFKGFEANTPTTIYEMVNPEGEFFKELVKHHVRAWLEEAKRIEDEENS